MLVLLLLAGTALAVLLLVLFSHYLFEENRTRVSRVIIADDEPVAETSPDELQWRTVVDPVEAANRARASKPFVAAYSRAMTAAYDDRSERAA